MYLVEDILKMKGSDVVTVAPDIPIQEALKIMGEKNIGALVVLQGDKVVGIFSERDLARKIIGKDACSLDTRVRDIMASPVITVKLASSIEDCMSIMTEKRFRHLPVVDNDVLRGIISIGDVVNSIISNREKMIEQLQGYITGTDYGH
jgi:CBS domain-containing protein